jgi:hypothetical protein
VVRRGVRDLDRDDVARAGRTRPHQRGAGREVDEPVVGRAAGEPGGRAVLATLALGDQQVDHPADLTLVLAPRDVVLQRVRTARSAS